jgi:hypothetical protein
MADNEEQNISFVFNTDVSSYSANTIKSIYETTWFNLVLHGLRNSFNRVIQSTATIEYAFSDRFKELLMEKTKGNPKYPYAFIVVNDVDLVKDQINTGAMSRHGLVHKRLQGDSVPMSFLFPFKMNCTLNVLDSDVNNLFSLSQAIFLADVSRAFNFGIKAFESQSIVKVLRTGNISFSESTINTEQDNDYGTGHITVGFEVQGWMGFTSFLPTVKNININVFTEQAAGTKPKLDFTYQLTLSEAADGKEHFNQLFTQAGGGQ